MSMFDLFRYDGKRAVVVGAASGMGNAAARLLVDAGAEVVGMDYADIDIAGLAGTIKVNLADKASIDAAVDECGGRVDALLSCAGVADGTPGLEKINFLGHRHMIERMIDAGMLGEGSAIGFISSAAGAGWMRDDNMAWISEYLSHTDMDEAAQWATDNGKADYFSSKLTVGYYVAHECFGLLKRGIRVNAIMPGPTDTPLAQANKEMWLGFGSDYRGDLGIEASSPEDQAYPLVFLCSDAAKAITGVTLTSDQGYFSSGITESYPAAKDIANFLNGRY
jgi:NAD(P)-dependent dehydrogenase (short-subunit alcohol dehydrogenase family)